MIKTFNAITMYILANMAIAVIYYVYIIGTTYVCNEKLLSFAFFANKKKIPSAIAEKNEYR